MNKKDPHKNKYESFVKTSDKVSIAFDHYKNGADRLIIIAPGFYNSKDALLLKDLSGELSRSYDVITLDFRGHGKSKGLFTWTSKEYLDLLAVLDSVKGQYQKIGLIGFSLGAATSIIAANKSDMIDSLILVSPPTEFKKIEYRLWELDLENDIRYSLFGEGRIGKGVRPGSVMHKKEKPIDLVAHLKQPVLYIHGTDDWIIKSWHSQTLFDRTKSKKRLVIIPGGLHAEYLLRKSKEKVLPLIQDWFLGTL